MRKFRFKFLRLHLKIKSLLDLTSDFDEQGTVSLVRSGVEFKSGNAWGLIFAIFIASIGLSVNSTAVIIGAMLISPLMGPIVGAGFSLGTHDFEMLKISIKNLTYAVAISIMTSTLFFMLVPVSSEISELLARTQPTIFDVLIAFFGGAAGIVASSRISKGNAVPGVAIATALMPPLCTVGYSLANLEWKFAVGAFYLFSINAVFILISTFLFTRLMGFQFHNDRNPLKDKLIHRYMTWGAIVFIIPSLFMAWYLHKKSQFENSLNEFINQELNLPSTMVAKKEFYFDLTKSKINIYLMGEELSEEKKITIEKKLLNFSALKNANLDLKSIQSYSNKQHKWEDQFLKKNELALFLNMEKNKEQSSLKFHSEKILHHLNTQFNNKILDLEIQDKYVRVIWKNKPTKFNLKQVETEIYKAYFNQNLVISQSVSVDL